MRERSLIQRIQGAEQSIGRSRDELRVIEDLWSFERNCQDSGIVMSPNDTPRAHQVVKAAEQGLLLRLKTGHRPPTAEESHTFFHDHTPFLISTDWDSILGDEAVCNNDEFFLPYEICTFEMILNGRPFVSLNYDAMSIAQSHPVDPDPPKFTIGFIKAGRYWVCVFEEGQDIEFAKFAWNQVRATSIALEAGLVEAPATRAAEGLNRKREKAGKEPLPDYRVVNLRRRYRTADTARSTGRHQRLHFRRGHWRHYPDHKTWVRWYLAGDPSLGVIQKHYEA